MTRDTITRQVIRRAARGVPGALTLIGMVRRRWHERVPHERIFSRIYRDNAWGSAESVSGPGSELAATRSIRAQLPDLWSAYGIRSLVDAPCGDFRWMSELVGVLDQYTGMDIVDALIDQNRERVRSVHVGFQRANLLVDPIPKADMILCRDCLIHFSFKDIARAIANFRASGSEYLLTTSYRSRPANADILTGSGHLINLERAPFNFPPPLAVLDEQCMDAPDKSLGLWRLADLPAFSG